MITNCNPSFFASNEHNVTIRAPNLEFIDITDEMLMLFEVHELYSLKKAVIDMWFRDGSVVDPRRAEQLFWV